MKPRTFSPIIIHKNPVEIPKVMKQNYSFEAYTAENDSSNIEDEDEDDDSCDTEDDSSDTDDDEEEILDKYKYKTVQKKHPVVITKGSSTPPVSNYLTSSSNSSLLPTFIKAPPLGCRTVDDTERVIFTTDYMNKMTLDLMINPHYLSKANPESFQRKVEQAQRILKHRREIYKTMGDCFDALEKLASGNGQEDVDLDIQTGFLHFAKMVLLNIQQHAGKSGTEPIFSVCNDIHSSFYPDEER